MAGFARVAEQDGVVVRSVDVSGFVLAEMKFPPGYVQADVEPELPYVALVLDGTLEKRFHHGSVELARSHAITMPAGARHAARFGGTGARVVLVKLRAGPNPVVCLDRLARVRAPVLAPLAWRLAEELRATDGAARLAAEGVALEILAAAQRETGVERECGREPAWLSAAEEQLRAGTGDSVRLSELAAALGVRPTQLARAFRVRYGVSVGEYSRRLRLAWAAGELAAGDTPVAAVATEAGFADQSHFTRLFKRYSGTTPARYRAAAQRQRRR